MKNVNLTTWGNCQNTQNDRNLLPYIITLLILIIYPQMMKVYQN